jgi:hypothetical protein
VKLNELVCVLNSVGIHSHGTGYKRNKVIDEESKDPKRKELFKMASRIKLALAIAWLTAVLIVLGMGSGLCASGEGVCFESGETMLVIMFWLSFPTSVVFLILAMFFVEYSSIHTTSDYLIVWFIMAFGGVLQWFFLAPRIFRKTDLVLLNLRSTTSTSPAVKTVMRKSRTRRKINHFDAQGRTPLERVLVQRSTDASA